MSLKFRLILLSFLQFFIWGAWLITIGAYWFQTKHWSGGEFGAIFSTMGISALFMPTIMGMLADRVINAEKLLGICHFMGGIILVMIPLVNSPVTMFPIMLVNMIFYMPTISLANTVSYTALKNAGKDVVKDFPPIRVWGTVGFIAAMWTVSLLHLEKTTGQFYVAAAASFALAVYSFSLPKCPPPLKGQSNKEAGARMGKDMFSLFRNRKMALFFIFSMLLGAALQLTNAYGDTFLHDFAKIPAYEDTIAVRYPAIIMSISQISETLFILAIPFFLKKFGIKQVMLMSMVAWVLRFGLFAYGNPAEGLWMIVLSCIIYGMAFDFFNISGSLFVETQSSASIRASAQGVFMMMTNGIGAVLGSVISGIIIEKFFTGAGGIMYWKSIWLTFASYSLVVAVMFAILFKHKHNPEAAPNITAH
ncbi:MAG: nucleoside permease [Niabella sp.]|nr:nucleoside permease [Niabella sp.]